MRRIDKVKKHKAVRNVTDERKTKGLIFVELKDIYHNPIKDGVLFNGMSEDCAKKIDKSRLSRVITGVRWNDILEDLYYVELVPETDCK